MLLRFANFSNASTKISFVARFFKFGFLLRILVKSEQLFALHRLYGLIYVIKGYIRQFSRRLDSSRSSDNRNKSCALQLCEYLANDNRIGSYAP